MRYSYLKAIVLLLACIFTGGYASAQTISTYAGGIGIDSSATTYGKLYSPTAVFVDPTGNLYISDHGYRKVNLTTGIITIDSALDGYWTNDAAGNIYMTNGTQVFRKDMSGNVKLIAGVGSGGFGGDGSIATAALLSEIRNVAIDHIGNIYIADEGNGRIRKVDTFGIINTIAGGGSTLGDGGPAISANVDPAGIVLDASGNLLVADYGNSRIRKINTSGIISTFIGPSAVTRPSDILIDPTGNLFVSVNNNNVYKISPSGSVSNIAGGGTTLGDGGPATAAIVQAEGICLDAFGNLFIADNNFSSASHCRVRKVNTSGTISTVAGNGLGFSGYSGDGGNSLLALFNDLSVTHADRFGNVYMIQDNRIRKINAAHIVSTIAGNGITGFSGDGGPALSAELDAPTGLCTDRAGNLYIADAGSAHVRKVSTSGIITTIAGGGTTGLGDNGPATAAEITTNNIAINAAGDIYITDGGHYRIRKIKAGTGIITTIAGTGTVGYTGDGGPATAAEITGGALAIDNNNNLYIMDGPVIRKVDTFGTIKTIAGGGSGSGDGGPATLAALSSPSLTIDKFGNLYVPDHTNNIVLEIDTFGFIHTIAGGGSQYGWAENIPAIDIAMNDPRGASIDTQGNLFFTEADPSSYGPSGPNISIRKICCLGNVIDHPPVFVHGVTQGISVCESSGTLSIDSLLRITDVDAGQQEKWTVTTLPRRGTLSGLPDSALSTGSAVSPSGTTYTPTTGTSGTDNFTIQVSDGLDHVTTTVTVTINPFSTASISGGNSVCGGDSIVLTGTGAGGIWSASNSKATVNDSGKVYGHTTGVDTIYYTISHCGSATAMHIITVNPLPVAAISGAATVCAGNSITLTGTTTGGAWSVSNSNATVTAGSVHGVNAGVDTISYTLVNACHTATVTATHTVSVTTTPPVGAITGASSVCAGSSILLSDSALGGTWLCSGPYATIISSSGVLIGYAAGTTVVTYTVSNTCGSTSVTGNITIAPPPYAGIITGAGTLCTGGTLTLNDAATGGTWSSANPYVATIGSTGIVTGVAVGSAIISYSISGGCGPAAAIAIVNVTAASPIDPVTGLSSVCTGFTISLGDATPGGTWSSSDPSIATVGSTGVVTGVAGGVVAVSYVGSLGCGTSVATSNITVNTAVSAGIISGSSTVCAGAVTVLSSYISGGTWSSSNSHASAGPTGIITGNTTGTDTITYTVMNSCGTANATHIINVYPAPVTGVITGITTVCAGGTTTLADTAISGTWSSTNTSIATISGTGVVTGVTDGTAAVSYTTTTGCGSAAAVVAIIVSVPSAGIITGVTTLCVGGTATLTGGVAGGTWASGTSAVATIGSTGIVTAVASGTTIISYTVSGACGAATATAILSVGSLPVVSPVTGVGALCMGSSTTLADATLRGNWSSSDTAVAKVDSTGVVRAIAGGASTISYNVTAGCGTSGAVHTITVDSPASAGIITGDSTLCAGAGNYFTDAIHGGAWLSSNTTLATIGSTGMTTGVAAGSTAILYIISNTCGSDTAIHPLVISPLPQAGTISGSTSLCAGTSTTLFSTIAGGVWASGAPATAVIGSASGIVDGVASGGVTIYYVITNSCGRDTTVQAMSVEPLANAGIITGDSIVCRGASLSLTDTSTGGTWGSTDAAIASSGSTGTVSGVANGSAAITYTVVNSCGSATAVRGITVKAPNAGLITGITTLCPGGTATLTDSVSGGAWSSSSPSVASIGSTGVVTGIAAGTSLVSYMVTDACGTATASAIFTIGSLPTVAPVAGANVICKNDTATLNDATIGGVWSSSNSAVATIGTSGIVTGVTTGTTVISYIVTAGCGANGSTLILTVQTDPQAGAITGKTSFCVNTSNLLSDAATGGSWSSSNPGVATINTSGSMLGIDTGSVVISYTITNSCGSATAVVTDTITTTVYPGIITGPEQVCAGNTIQLGVAIAGGSWSSSMPDVAPITQSGILTGLKPGSTAVSYAITNSCGINSQVAFITVDDLPYIAAITGPSSVALNDFISLSDASGGGVWRSTDSLVATVNQGGIVTGLTLGSADIIYTLVNSFGCTIDTTLAITVSSGVSVNSFEVFPNPTRGVVKVKWQDQLTGKADIYLYDVLGQEAYHGNILIPASSGQTQLTIPNLVTGMYFITIKSVSASYTGKLLYKD